MKMFYLMCCTLLKQLINNRLIISASFTCCLHKYTPNAGCSNCAIVRLNVYYKGDTVS